MTIATVLHGKGTQVETVRPDERLSDAVRRLGEKRIGAMPVVEDGRIVGIISERDVIYCLKDHGADELARNNCRARHGCAGRASPDHAAPDSPFAGRREWRDPRDRVDR